MGRSDPFVFTFYKDNIKPIGRTALLGFTDNILFKGDLYDLQIGNWNINSDWRLNRKYDTIISLRCPYFSKEPKKFIDKCYEHLNDDGQLCVDWGLGDHWRFQKYKVGWVKEGEHEWAYEKDNFLWSMIWDDSFLSDKTFKEFVRMTRNFGYHEHNIKEQILEEIPSILELSYVQEKFKKTKVKMLTLWGAVPQLYCLIMAQK